MAMAVSITFVVTGQRVGATSAVQRMRQSWARRKFGSDKCFYLFSFVIFVLFWASSIFVFMVMKLYPEIGMVAHSQVEYFR